MIHHERSRTIDAPPEAVWAVLSRYMHIDEIAPMVTSVEALTEATTGVGARRRCHFQDGGSMVEEVTDWRDGDSYTVRIIDAGAMPLKEGRARISLRPEGAGTHVAWGMAYRVKYGPLGWLLGQTMMKMMMSKVLDGNLEGLAQRARAET